ncbi:MAG TPA: YggS family pyridoxal phosphate-dependent enzyme [Pleomorphomonadaceae bacterium]|nr:YggS family pyridoxal phosphate-dependent enzyme [Pleomorphomonadaceae bacterium]
MTDTDQLAAAIAGRWAQVQARIDAAAAAGGRDPARVRVVAVTKGFGIEVVRAARRAGLERFGENRVQEAEPKVAAAPDAEWHLVGHLQSNKARRAVAMFPWLEAIDSVALLERVDALAGELGLRPRVLLQVNLTGSASQHGFGLAELGSGARDRTELARSVASIRAVQVQGLMGIGPLTSQADASRAAFARLGRVRDELEQATGKPLPELSMGMSADLESAVAEGATLVRAGTALFGERPTD